MENGVLWSTKFMVNNGYNKQLNDRLARFLQILLFTGSCQKYLQDWILEEQFLDWFRKKMKPDLIRILDSNLDLIRATIFVTHPV